MNLLCYSLFYSVALVGGAARCASTRFPNCQFSIDEVRAKLIVNCPLSILKCFTVLLNDEKLTLPGVV